MSSSHTWSVLLGNSPQTCRHVCSDVPVFGFFQTYGHMEWILGEALLQHARNVSNKSPCKHLQCETCCPALPSSCSTSSCFFASNVRQHKSSVHFLRSVQKETAPQGTNTCPCMRSNTEAHGSQVFYVQSWPHRSRFTTTAPKFETLQEGNTHEPNSSFEFLHINLSARHDMRILPCKYHYFSAARFMVKYRNFVRRRSTIFRSKNLVSRHIPHVFFGSSLPLRVANQVLY